MKGFHLQKAKKEKEIEKVVFADRFRLIDLLIHDLRGPLSVVSTTVTNLIHKPERYGKVTDGQRRVLERIARNSRKAQLLLQEMIEVFQSEEGVFHKDYFPIEEVLKDSLVETLEVNLPAEAEQLGELQTQEAIDLYLRKLGIFCEIKGKYARSAFCHDQRMIQRVLRNLISNAIKYRRHRVQITLRGSKDLHVIVEDDGPGIPAKGQEAIFERFVRLTNKESAQIPGLGLGLSGVKALVKAMGGDILFMSKEGAGTRFVVQIPPLDVRKEERKVKESILNEKKILAVDDEADVLEVLEEEILDSCPNCLIDKATSYDKASEMLNTWTYDIVILDIMGVRGFDLLKLARKRNFPVAMLTAHALSPEALKKSIELGARAYLPKEKLGEIVPFLEDILEYEAPAGWNRLFDKLGGFFDKRFGPDWQKGEDRFWKDVKADIGGRFDRVIIK